MTTTPSTTADDDAASGWEDAGSGSGSSGMLEVDVVPCYSGFFGECETCDAQGSCICGSNSDGFSDFILMDRTQWNEPRLLCTVSSTAIQALHVVSTAAAFGVLIYCMRTMQVQAAIARNCRASYLEHRPLKLLLCGSISLIFSIVMSVWKLADPSLIQAVDVLPSTIEFLRMATFILMTQIHAFHIMVIAAGTQMTSLGQQHVDDIVRAKRLTMVIQALAGIAFSSISVLTSVLSKAGYHSIELQTTMFLSRFALDVAGSSTAIAIAIRDARFFNRWFSASIQAAQESFAVASGGVSHARADNRVSDPIVMPRYLAEILETVSQLERARHNILMPRWLWTIGALSLPTSYLVSLGNPLLWSRMSYILPLQQIFCAFIMSQVCQLYSASVLSSTFHILRPSGPLRMCKYPRIQRSTGADRHGGQQAQPGHGIRSQICQQV